MFNSFQFSQAREIFKEIVKKDGTNPRIAEVYYYLGRLSIEPDSALFYYTKLIQKHPTSRYTEIAFLEIAKIHIARENYRDAVVVLNELQKNFPDTNLKVETMFWLGVSYLGLKKTDEGLSILKNLQNSFPKSVWAERATNIMPSKEENNKEYFTIQVGSYRNQKYAQKFAEEIKEKGFDAEIIEASVKGNLYYRVWVGKFLSLDKAKAFHKKLDSLGIKGNVVKGY